MTTFSACESPRWLIIQGDYKKAFTTLERLRKSRVLAAKELVSIHYQIQAERSLFLRRQLDEETLKLNPFQRELGRTTYWERLYNMFFFPRYVPMRNFASLDIANPKQDTKSCDCGDGSGKCARNLFETKKPCPGQNPAHNLVLGDCHKNDD